MLIKSGNVNARGLVVLDPKTGIMYHRLESYNTETREATILTTALPTKPLIQNEALFNEIAKHVKIGHEQPELIKIKVTLPESTIVYDRINKQIFNG